MKTGIFCPKCGEEEGDFYEGFCINCYKKMNIEIKFPLKIKLSQCKHCGMWLIQNKWVTQSYEELIKMVKKKVESNLYNIVVDVEVDEEKEKMVIKLSGSLDAQNVIKVTEEREISFKIKESTCDTCMKKGARYFETKLQLRRKEIFDLNKFEKIKKYIVNEVEYFSQKEHEAGIFWMEELNEGTDCFFGSKKVAAKIIKNMIHKYKLKAERSSKLIGLTRSGKRKMRATYCVRI